MEEFLEFVKTDNFVMWSSIINIFLVILVIVLIILVIRMNRKYISFMNKLGKGEDLDQMLKKYLREVADIKQDNSEIKAYYTKLDYDIGSGIQKVGLIRYNAFQNVGSDLSFAVALLDRENNGIVLNGLYGSERLFRYDTLFDRRGGENRRRLQLYGIRQVYIAAVKTNTRIHRSYGVYLAVVGFHIA